VAVIEQVDISTPGSAYQVAFGMLVVVSACALISATNMAASKQTIFCLLLPVLFTCPNLPI